MKCLAPQAKIFFIPSRTTASVLTSSQSNKLEKVSRTPAWTSLKISPGLPLFVALEMTHAASLLI